MLYCALLYSLLDFTPLLFEKKVMHSPLDTHKGNMEAWRVFESFHKQGVVRQLGISNCYDLMVLKAIYEDAVVKPSVVQNRCSRADMPICGLVSRLQV
jgi:diketogulonate reductase-like aldo/keto reductase